MVKIRRVGSFDRLLEALYLNNEELRSIVKQKIRLFEKNPDDTRLRNHKLTRKLSGKWAFSITEDIRIVYKWLGKNRVRFLAIGLHNKVYEMS